MADSSPLSDETLLLRLKAGSPDPLAVLHARHAERLYWQARRLGLEHEDADEVVLDTFKRVYTRIATYSPSSGARGLDWIRQILHNLAIDRLRRLRPTAVLRDEDPDEAASADTWEEDELRRQCFESAWSGLSEADQAELMQGRGRGPGRKGWHRAAEHFRELFEQCYDVAS